VKPKIVKVKEVKKKEYFQKCVVCKTKLSENSINEPFSIHSIIGQEAATLFSYLECPKCGLMYQKTTKTLRKEKEQKEFIGFGTEDGGESITNPFSAVSSFTHSLFPDVN